MASAFAPAHVSGLFAVHDEAPDILAKGSRGAGWCLDQGATAHVRQAAPGTGIAIRIDGKPTSARVTHQALERLAPGRGLDVEIRLDLPMGQGFGMSAAGTLAACLAASNELGLEPEAALEAAHAAEVEAATGLGDAVAAWSGGAEVRVRAGVPPYGQLLRVDPPADTEFLFAILGRPIPTPSIIRDAAWKARTRHLGDAAVDRIVATGKPTAWAAILAESAAFSQALGLMPPGMAALGASLAGLQWGQAMLGSTLWATGPRPLLDAAERSLRAAGPVHRAGLDRGGARLVRSPLG